jgi:hypothetical protein
VILLEKMMNELLELKMIKNKYLYYLTKYIDEVEIIDSKETKTTIKKQKYQERDLHKFTCQLFTRSKKC